MKQKPSPESNPVLAWLRRNWIAILVLAISAAVFALAYWYANTPLSDTHTVVVSGTVLDGSRISAPEDGGTCTQQLLVQIDDGSELDGETVQLEYTFSTNADSINNGEALQNGETVYLNVQVENGEVVSAGITTEAALSTTVLTYETAKILRVVSDDSYQDSALEGAYRGDQTLEVELTSGAFKGTVVTIVNYLGPLARSHVGEGEMLTVSVSSVNGELDEVAVLDYNRQWVVLAVVLAFILATALVGGRTGLKSILGLGLTVICLIFVLVPLLLKGFDPIWTIFIMCAYISVVCFTILGGINRKIICAILGTVSGVALAAIFAYTAGYFLRVNGYRLIADDVEALLNLRQAGTPIRLAGLLTGGIMVAALGAVMDVAMSISSAISELADVNPDMTRKALWRSAMNIGRDMVGTMTNTLILAFVGSTLVTIIYYYALGTTFQQLMGSYWFCVELLRGIASSIGVILSVPLAALIGSVFFGAHKPAPQPKKAKK